MVLAGLQDLDAVVTGLEDERSGQGADVRVVGDNSGLLL
jgi:hypothetical protein